ncbi:MAG: pyridoxal phosphate enzyme (YggS family) [Kiritimatiellia bacterium]|jgi:pyridoxal phosphate enzyme (YggS family)
MIIASNLATIRAQLDLACVDAGRSPQDVQLVAVSKTKPLEAVLDAWNAGQRHFGENYAQELRDKGAAMERAEHDVRWHFIGQIQRNKAKYIAPRAFRVHSVHHVAHAEALAARAPDSLKVLLNVNVAGEQSKGGLAPAEALDRAAEIHALNKIDVVGLMTMPPFSEDPEASAPYFEELAHLAATGRDRGLPIVELSMGMTHDFRVAVRYGATWVRIGTAIFGARERR